MREAAVIQPQECACANPSKTHHQVIGVLTGKPVIAYDSPGDQHTVVRKLGKVLVRIDVTPDLLTVSTHAIRVEVERRIDHVQRVSEDEPHWRLRCA